MERRLPVYMLLDCSGSMYGDPIQGVRNGVQLLHESLLKNPAAMDTAYLSVITFATKAKVETPLTNLFEFAPPDIEASGMTAMGAALNLLADSVAQEVQRKKSEAERGDYRPMVFLFTDGHPTDEDVFPQAAQKVRNMRWGQFVACAGGVNVDLDKLREVTDTVLLMEQMSSETLKSYFKWVSDSIASSVTPSAAPPPLPQGVVDLRKTPL